MRIVFLFLFVCLLQGCASSDVSRNTTGEIDKAYIDSSSSINNLGKGSLASAYQNTNQATKGVILGGVAGGLIGGFTNGIGAVIGVTTGAILGGSLGAYIDAHTSLVDKLKNHAVKVFVLGDQVLIVIPSSHLFQDRSPNINHDEYSTLDLVAELISNYVNITVQVAAYTNANGPAEVDLAFSQQQANTVARYLWKRGVNTRLLYAVGYGGTHLVTKNSLNNDCNDNYRIEITFEKLPVC